MNASFPPSADVSATPPNVTARLFGQIGGWAMLVLLLGCIAVLAPTMIYVARESWGTEQGSHSPIVLATGLWLLWRMWPDAKPAFRQPPLWRVVALLLIMVPAYVVARICQAVEIEGFSMYGLLLIALYSAIGGRAMRQLWFPLFYLAFIFPPPESIVFFLTMPLKSLISQASVALLAALGYPIGGAGVMIVIGQYELLVAAACSGLNSIISLSALTLFYVYIRHQAEPLYSVLLTMLIVPIALLANFVRVLILILLTYYGGDAVGQGFMHNFAGVLMFVLALGTVFLIDTIGMRIWQLFRPQQKPRPLFDHALTGDTVA